MSRLDFEDDDLRQHSLSDCWWGPCPLIAAHAADNLLDEAWQWGDHKTYEESLTYWRACARKFIETQMVLVWQLCCEHLLTKENPCPVVHA